MATLQAARILGALEKAKKVGLVEEPISIDGCSIVLQNLSTDDYDAINSELEGLDESEYLHAFMDGHICRAIVEVEGQDLRGVEFIEDEVPSGKVLLSASLPKAKAEELLKEVLSAGGEGSIAPEGETRLVRLERSNWIKTRLLSGWSREALLVAWRKFTELLSLAEEKAKDGVSFRVPDETAEDKFRRLLVEMKEAEDNLPPELASKILDEVGYMSKSSAAELEAAEQRLRRLASERKESLSEEPQVAPKEEAAKSDGPDPQELMNRRQPLNRQAVAPPIPEAKTPAKPSAPAKVPDQIRKAAQANTNTLSRSARIAALESAVDPSLGGEALESAVSLSGDEIPELVSPAPSIDNSEVSKVLDRPPVVGINPRFKPAPR